MSFEERIIEEVRKHELIYNLRHYNYRRGDVKEKIWKEISQNLGTSVEKCKQRWSNLRDRFKKLWRARNLPSGSGASEKIKWEHYDRLMFLTDVEDQNSTTGNYEYVHEEISYEFEELDASLYINEEGASSSEPPRKRPKTSKNQEVHKSFCEFLKTATHAISDVRNDGKCEISLYFEAMAQKIKNSDLPRGLWNELEHKISLLVYTTIQSHEQNL